MKEWVFHVRHNAKPTTVKETLLILDGHDGITLDEILSIGNDRGYTVGTTARSAQSVRENPVQTARDLGLVESNRYALTEAGKQVARLFHLKPHTAIEFLHFLHYATWVPQRPERSCFSWSYMMACTMLWESSPVPVDRSRLAEQLANAAREQFGISTISLSERSVQGVLNWLAELQPPVLREERQGKAKATVFTCRSFCPPETFVLAVDYLYRQRQVDYQTNLLLDADKRDAICRICLLDPTGFDGALDWACGQFDFLSQGAGGGWGRYLVLARPPTLADFMG